MLDSIIVVGLILVSLVIMVVIGERLTQRGSQSEQYYRYLQNNKVPPPEDPSVNRAYHDVYESGIWRIRKR